jgi:hypothetical protein
MRVALVVAVALSSSDAFASSYLQSERALLRFSLAAVEESAPPDAAVDVIRTKDGRLHVGRIVDRVPTGYLFRSEQEASTYVIEYSTVDDVKSATAATVNTPVQPPATPPPAPFFPWKAQPDRVALMASINADIKRLEEEFDDNGLFGPIVKMVIGAVCFGFAPVAATYQSGTTLPLALVLVAGTAFAITGVVQLILRLVRRSRIESELSVKRADLERLQARPATSGRMDTPLSSWATAF